MKIGKSISLYRKWEQARRACSLFVMRLLLPLHIDDGFQHLVTYGDNLGVGLEAALGDDHVSELVGDVYVRLLLL